MIGGPRSCEESLAQLVAEELRVPFNAITMVMGDTDLTPWDMGTFGSRSTPAMGSQASHHGLYGVADAVGRRCTAMEG